MVLNSTRIQAFADELEKIAVSVDMPLLSTLLGGAGAAYGAHKLTRDPRYKTRNALIALLPGLLGGRALGGALFPNDPSTADYLQQIRGGQAGLTQQARDVTRQIAELQKAQEALSAVGSQPLPVGLPG